MLLFVVYSFHLQVHVPTVICLVIHLESRTAVWVFQFNSGVSSCPSFNLLLSPPLASPLLSQLLLLFSPFGTRNERWWLVVANKSRITEIHHSSGDLSSWSIPKYLLLSCTDSSFFFLWHYGKHSVLNFKWRIFFSFALSLTKASSTHVFVDYFAQRPTWWHYVNLLTCDLHDDFINELQLLPDVVFRGTNWQTTSDCPGARKISLIWCLNASFNYFLK